MSRLASGDQPTDALFMDDDVRCEVGLVRGSARTAAYAGLGNGDPAVLVPALRGLGERVRALVS